MAVLDLPIGTRTLVFRYTEKVLKADPTLASVIQTWKTWDGTKDSYGPDLSSQCPVLRLEPSIGPMSWYDPSSQFGPVVIKVGMVIQSRYADDYLNLWEAVENALYPRGDVEAQFRIMRGLTDRGAEIGQFEFVMPATDPNPREVEDGMFDCYGMIRISVVRTFG